jgi:propanediol dehydratase small subunit
VLKPHSIEPNKEQLREITLKVKDIQEKREAEKAKIKEDFIKNYYDIIRKMALSMDEVLDIANKVMSK